MKKSTREVMYFALVLALFFLAAKSAHYLNKVYKVDKNLVYISVSVIYTGMVVFCFFLAGLHNCQEGYWDITPAALCKGGSYFWQGDSSTSEMCRKMSETPKGMVEISGYNCPTGYVGQPGLPFYYTPLSDDGWQNERCEDLPNCPLSDVGMCSLEKQIP
jgi:hypothetical protein